MSKAPRLAASVLALGACVGLTFTVVGLGGCAAAETYDTSGPPPEGYDSWDEFFEAEDQLQRDMDATRRNAAVNRSVPGVPVNR